MYLSLIQYSGVGRTNNNTLQVNSAFLVPPRYILRNILVYVTSRSSQTPDNCAMKDTYSDLWSSNSTIRHRLDDTQVR